MVPLFSLWLPILVSAVVVFVASSVLHMLLPYHRKDFRKLPNEDAAREAIGKLNIPPGDYMLPCGDGPKAMKDPVFIEKLTKGPVAIMTVMQPGPPSMGKNLVQWFIYCLVVGVLAAYITGHAVAARRRLPRRLPLRGLHRVHRLRDRPVAGLDLVPARVEHDDQEHHRRSHLRTPDRGRLRVALAAMTRLLWYPGHELLLEDIVRAENCSLFDSQGKRYVDLESGVWCTSIGHAHPRILKVLAEQPARIAHTGFSYTSAVVEEAAREVLSLLGFDGGKCVFLCSGSEAVEYGVRVAQMLSDRPLLLTMTDSYFGAYGSASTRRADEWYGFDWMGCPNCPPERGATSTASAGRPSPSIGSADFSSSRAAPPVSCAFPPSRLSSNLARTVQQNGGFVLVNEVTTGVGRTGTWFGYQHYGIAPDIVAMGKGIGNGYPVSVTAFARGVVDRLGRPAGQVRAVAPERSARRGGRARGPAGDPRRGADRARPGDRGVPPGRTPADPGAHGPHQGDPRPRSHARGRTGRRRRLHDHHPRAP